MRVVTNRLLYAIHRWVAAVALLQVGAWTLSGLFFTAVPIETVRGPFVEGAHDAPLDGQIIRIAPATAIEAAQQHGVEHPDALEIVSQPEGVFYLVRGSGAVARIDAQRGGFSPVEEAEAIRIAQRDQPESPSVRTASRITEAPTEYRGKPLPAWQIQLEDEWSTVVYVDASTGQVRARRTDIWRLYDFLWSLHIMDYGGRSDFNHPLLIAAAALGFLTFISGTAIWIARLSRYVRRRKKQGPQSAGTTVRP